MAKPDGNAVIPEAAGSTAATATPEATGPEGQAAAPKDVTREDIIASLAESDMCSDAQAAADDQAGDAPQGEPGKQEADPKTPDPEPGKPDAKPAEPQKDADAIAQERQKLAAERATLDAERKRFEASMEASKREIAGAEQQATQLEQFAKEWDEEGKADMAERARAKAGKIRGEVEAAKTATKIADFHRAQSAVLKEVITEWPDLKDPRSPMTQQMDALLKSRPQLLAYPEGIRDAAAFVGAQQKAARSQALEKENAELKGKVADYERRLQPATRGITSAPRGDRSFAELPPAEQRDQLMKTMRREGVTS